MTIEEAIRGESKNIEFKEMLPQNSENYVKTVIGFANTQGGKLLIGVEDETRKIVGVDDTTLFQQMDRISNAVSDSCEPQIIPNIEPYTIDGKTIIIVTVSPGPHRPYYLKSKGKEKGTFIRVAGTTRPATPYKIKELEMEGAKISWDELVCVDYPVTEKAIKKLCQDMNHYRREMQKGKPTAEKKPPVTRVNLENWNVLKKTSDGYAASNAFALLTGSHFPFAKTQCAVFAGTERGKFIDKTEYTGPLYEQIESAYAFVLRNIRLAAKIEGLIRRESYELPPDAIREMIINAHCHRNYQDESCVQVALYENRLEVTSPGGLCYGLTLDEALSGRSRQRNRAIAEVFNQMGLIEAWGNGLKSICNAAKDYDLPEPEFIEMPETFRVNLYRNPLDAGKKDPASATDTDTKTGAKTNTKTDTNTNTKTSTKTDTKTNTKTNTSETILALIQETPGITQDQLAQKTGLSKSGVRYALNKLRDAGILAREGTRKDGRWVILVSESNNTSR